MSQPNGRGKPALQRLGGVSIPRDPERVTSEVWKRRDKVVLSWKILFPGGEEVKKTLSIKLRNLPQ